MDRAKQGDRVKIHYTVTLANGDLIDTSENSQPLEFIIGEGNVISGIEQNAANMEVGAIKMVEITPEEGFGQWTEKLVVDVPKSILPREITPYKGQKLQMYPKNGEPVDTTVIEIKEDSITVDANHSLAGHSLFCTIQLIEICSQ